MNTSELQNRSVSAGVAPASSTCPRRCHLCRHSYSHRVRYGDTIYSLGQRCHLYGDVPLDAVAWRREQNRAYDEATLRLADAPPPCRLALPQNDDDDG